MRNSTAIATCLAIVLLLAVSSATAGVPVRSVVLFDHVLPVFGPNTGACIMALYDANGRLVGKFAFRYLDFDGNGVYSLGDPVIYQRWIFKDKS